MLSVDKVKIRIDVRWDVSKIRVRVECQSLFIILELRSTHSSY